MTGYIDRWLLISLEKYITKPFVHILFGARQTGKTTLLDMLFPSCSLRYNLADPEERTRLLADPGLFRRECEALPVQKTPHTIIIDEAQATPMLFDAVQVLYDKDKMRWRFILCGSSARKLRKTCANLLPGRSILHRLYPLTMIERPPADTQSPQRLIPMPLDRPMHSVFPAADIEERMAYGELPGIILLPDEDRKAILKSFVTLHLEEEIRREALVKDWGAFVNFLRLAASESGQIVNYSSISRETGLSEPTVKSHYQLLEDMFIGFYVPAYSKSPRKNLLSTPRFFFFDPGIRHSSAGIIPDINVVRSDPGKYFEQWVGIEIWKRLQYLGNGQMYYFRTKDGAEVDFIVRIGNNIIPVEVKWSSNPSIKDVSNLVSFMRENPLIKTGYVVCRCQRPAALSDRIIAIPWQSL